MLILLSVPCAFLLDLMFGDPAFLPHPVVLMGKCISGMERRFRSAFPKTPQGEFRAGALMAFFLPVLSFLITAALCIGAYLLHPVICFCLTTFLEYQALAVKGLWMESRNVGRALKEEGLDAGRKAVARIVGRDTASLSEEGVIRAAVETVAENFSDGVLAPLFYMCIGGAPLALAYKAVNTMDSMCGYKNKRYLYYGRAAARLDDVWNFIPSRLAALLMILAAFLMRETDGREAFRIWKRDRRKHASPNSAQTESACAGALGVRLAGPAYYFGTLHEKPYIGDPRREIEREDIRRADQLMLAGSILGVLSFSVLRLIVVMLA